MLTPAFVRVTETCSQYTAGGKAMYSLEEHRSQLRKVSIY